MKNYLFFLAIFLLVSCNNDKIVRHRFQGVVCDSNTKIPIGDVTISAIDSLYYLYDGDTIKYALDKEIVRKTDGRGKYIIPEVIVNEGGYRELKEIAQYIPQIFIFRKENYQLDTIHLIRYTRNSLYEKKIILYTVDTVFLKRIEE